MILEKAMVISKSFGIKADADSVESKTWSLELTIPSGTTINDLARAVLASEVIKVQNANRKHWTKFPNRHVFKKTFNKPGIDEDPEMAIVAKLSAMTPEEQTEYLQNLAKKASTL